MADKDVTEKIDSFLHKTKKTKAVTAKSFIPMKKLINCDWSKEEHLRDVALECFAEIFYGDDDMAEEFRKQMAEKTKGICENVIKMYMTSNDIDMLPAKGK
jgi:hypothetical protein